MLNTQVSQVHPGLITLQWWAGYPVDRSHFGQSCLPGVQIWLSTGFLTGDFLQLQGAIPPGFYPLREGGLDLLCGAWGGPNKRNVDRAEGIFGHARRVWVLALQQDPP